MLAWKSSRNAIGGNADISIDINDNTMPAAASAVIDGGEALARAGELTHVGVMFNQRKGGDPMSSEVSVLVKGFGIVVVMGEQPSS